MPMKASCSFYVEGMDMRCLLCGTLVRSGNHHSCNLDMSRPAIQASAKQKPKASPKKKAGGSLADPS